MKIGYIHMEFERPRCLLLITRHRGTDRMGFLDNLQFNHNTFTLLGGAERFLRDTLPIAGRFKQDRIERLSYERCPDSCPFSIP